MEEEIAQWSKVPARAETKKPQQKKAEDVLKSSAKGTISTSNAFASADMDDDPYTLLMKMEKGKEREKKKKDKMRGLTTRGDEFKTTAPITKNRRLIEKREEEERRKVEQKERRIEKQQITTLRFKEEAPTEATDKKKEKKAKKVAEQVKAVTVEDASAKLTLAGINAAIAKAKQSFSEAEYQAKDVIGFIEQAYTTVSWKHTHEVEQPLHLLNKEVKKALIDYFKSLSDETVDLLINFIVDIAYAKDGQERKSGSAIGFKQALQLIARANPAQFGRSIVGLKSTFGAGGAAFRNFTWLLEQLMASSQDKQLQLSVFASLLDDLSKKNNLSEENRLKIVQLIGYAIDLNPAKTAESPISTAQFLSLITIGKEYDIFRVLYEKIKDNKNLLRKIVSAPAFFETTLAQATQSKGDARAELVALLALSLQANPTVAATAWSSKLGSTQKESMELLRYMKENEVGVPAELKEKLEESAKRSRNEALTKQVKALGAAEEKPEESVTPQKSNNALLAVVCFFVLFVGVVLSLLYSCQIPSVKEGTLSRMCGQIEQLKQFVLSKKQ